MKTQFKLITAAVAAAVSLGMSAPLWAAAHTGAAGTDVKADSKAERKRCQEMPKGAERDSCMKTVRASEKSARRASDTKGADRSSPSSSSEVAGKIQKSPTGTETDKSSLPQTPKGSSETASGVSKGERAARPSKGADMSGGPVTTPKSPSETAGKAK